MPRVKASVPPSNHTTMLNTTTMDRLSLKREAWARRDIEASSEQLLETRNLEVSFRYARVLLSKSRLRAEVFLQQN